MPSKHTVNIQAILRLHDETVFKKSHDGKYIDLICSHHTPKNLSGNEAFNLRILLNEQRYFTIQIHWDCGEIIDEYVNLNTSNTFEIIHGLYDEYITYRGRHLNRTKKVQSQYPELYQSMMSTCNNFILILQNIIKNIEADCMIEFEVFNLDSVQCQIHRKQCTVVMRDIRIKMDAIFKMIANGEIKWKEKVKFTTENEIYVVNTLETQIDGLVLDALLDDTEIVWVFEHLRFHFRQAMQSAYVQNFCSGN
jgi:hypothetical protein